MYPQDNAETVGEQSKPIQSFALEGILGRSKRKVNNLANFNKHHMSHAQHQVIEVLEHNNYSFSFLSSHHKTDEESALVLEQASEELSILPVEQVSEEPSVHSVEHVSEEMSVLPVDEHHPEVSLAQSNEPSSDLSLVQSNEHATELSLAHSQDLSAISSLEPSSSIVNSTSNHATANVSLEAKSAVEETRAIEATRAVVDVTDTSVTEYGRVIDAVLKEAVSLPHTLANTSNPPSLLRHKDLHEDLDYSLVNWSFNQTDMHNFRADMQKMWSKNLRRGAVSTLDLGQIVQEYFQLALDAASDTYYLAGVFDDFDCDPTLPLLRFYYQTYQLKHESYTNTALLCFEPLMFNTLNTKLASCYIPNLSCNVQKLGTAYFEYGLRRYQCMLSHLMESQNLSNSLHLEVSAFASLQALKQATSDVYPDLYRIAQGNDAISANLTHKSVPNVYSDLTLNKGTLWVTGKNGIASDFVMQGEQGQKGFLSANRKHSSHVTFEGWTRLNTQKENALSYQAQQLMVEAQESKKARDQQLYMLLKQAQGSVSGLTLLLSQHQSPLIECLLEQMLQRAYTKPQGNNIQRLNAAQMNLKLQGLPLSSMRFFIPMTNVMISSVFNAKLSQAELMLKEGLPKLLQLELTERLSYESGKLGQQQIVIRNLYQQTLHDLGLLGAAQSKGSALFESSWILQDIERQVGSELVNLSKSLPVRSLGLEEIQSVQSSQTQVSDPWVEQERQYENEFCKQHYVHKLRQAICLIQDLWNQFPEQMRILETQAPLVFMLSERLRFMHKLHQTLDWFFSHVGASVLRLALSGDPEALCSCLVFMCRYLPQLPVHTTQNESPNSLECMLLQFLLPTSSSEVDAAFEQTVKASSSKANSKVPSSEPTLQDSCSEHNLASLSHSRSLNNTVDVVSTNTLTSSLNNLHCSSALEHSQIRPTLKAITLAKLALEQMLPAVKTQGQSNQTSTALQANLAAWDIWLQSSMALQSFLYPETPLPLDVPFMGHLNFSQAYGTFKGQNLVQSLLDALQDYLGLRRLPYEPNYLNLSNNIENSLVQFLSLSESELLNIAISIQKVRNIHALSKNLKHVLPPQIVAHLANQKRTHDVFSELIALQKLELSAKNLKQSQIIDFLGQSLLEFSIDKLNPMTLLMDYVEQTLDLKGCLWKERRSSRLLISCLYLMNQVLKISERSADKMQEKMLGRWQILTSDLELSNQAAPNVCQEQTNVNHHAVTKSEQTVVSSEVNSDASSDANLGSISNAVSHLAVNTKLHVGSRLDINSYSSLDSNSVLSSVLDVKSKRSLKAHTATKSSSSLRSLQKMDELIMHLASDQHMMGVMIYMQRRMESRQIADNIQSSVLQSFAKYAKSQLPNINIGYALLEFIQGMLGQLLPKNAVKWRSLVLGHELKTLCWIQLRTVQLKLINCHAFDQQSSELILGCKSTLSSESTSIERQEDLSSTIRKAGEISQSTEPSTVYTVLEQWLHNNTSAKKYYAVLKEARVNSQSRMQNVSTTVGLESTLDSNTSKKLNLSKQTLSNTQPSDLSGTLNKQTSTQIPVYRQQDALSDKNHSALKAQDVALGVNDIALQSLCNTACSALSGEGQFVDVKLQQKVLKSLQKYLPEQETRLKEWLSVPTRFNPLNPESQVRPSWVDMAEKQLQRKDALYYQQGITNLSTVIAQPLAFSMLQTMVDLYFKLLQLHGRQIQLTYVFDLQKSVTERESLFKEINLLLKLNDLRQRYPQAIDFGYAVRLGRLNAALQMQGQERNLRTVRLKNDEYYHQLLKMLKEQSDFSAAECALFDASFGQIFEAMNKGSSSSALQLIHQLSSHYGEHLLQMHQVKSSFVLMYFADCEFSHLTTEQLDQNKLKLTLNFSLESTSDKEQRLSRYFGEEANKRKKTQIEQSPFVLPVSQSLLKQQLPTFANRTAYHEIFDQKAPYNELCRESQIPLKLCNDDFPNIRSMSEAMQVLQHYQWHNLNMLPPMERLRIHKNYRGGINIWLAKSVHQALTSLGSNLLSQGKDWHLPVHPMSLFPDFEVLLFTLMALETQQALFVSCQHCHQRQLMFNDNLFAKETEQSCRCCDTTLNKYGPYPVILNQEKSGRIWRPIAG